MAYSASILVSLACQICNCPGRIIQAGQLLNMILSDLAQTYDMDTVRKTTTLNIGPQATIPYPYPLPSDYLRYYDVFYLVDGEPFYLNPKELKDFDALFTGDGIDNYPEWFATDMAVSPGGAPAVAPSMYFYPPPAIPLAVTLRYRPQTTEIVSPENSATIPWYPNQLSLLKMLCLQVGDAAGGDDRSPRWEREVENRMRKYLAMDDDKGGFAQTVKLDPGTFRNRGNLPPSKKTGF